MRPLTTRTTARPCLVAVSQGSPPRASTMPAALSKTCVSCLPVLPSGRAIHDPFKLSAPLCAASSAANNVAPSRAPISVTAWLRFAWQLATAKENVAAFPCGLPANRVVSVTPTWLGGPAGTWRGVRWRRVTEIGHCWPPPRVAVRHCQVPPALVHEPCPSVTEAMRALLGNRVTAISLAVSSPVLSIAIFRRFNAPGWNIPVSSSLDHTVCSRAGVLGSNAPNNRSLARALMFLRNVAALSAWPPPSLRSRSFNNRAISVARFRKASTWAWWVLSLAPGILAFSSSLFTDTSSTAIWSDTKLFLPVSPGTGPLGRRSLARARRWETCPAMFCQVR